MYKRQNKNRVKGEFLKNVISRAFPSAVCVILSVLAFLVLDIIFVFPENTVSTMATLITGFIGFVTLYDAGKPFDAKRVILFCILAVLFIIAICVFGGLFELVKLGLTPFIMVCAAAAAVIPVSYTHLKRRNSYKY